MTTETITLLNTISRVPAVFEKNYANRLLADPHYGKILKVVDSEKPEVLGQTTVDGVPVDDEGEPIKALPAATDVEDTRSGDTDKKKG